MTCRSDLHKKDLYTVQSIKVETRYLSEIYNIWSQVTAVITPGAAI